MGRRITRVRRPSVEQCERRELLSAITGVLAANSLLSSRHAPRVRVNLAGGGGSGAGSAGGSGGQGSSAFASSISLGGVTLNQGPLLNPDGTINNLALAPTGNPTPGERRRQQFVARFVGPYSVQPGRTSTEAIQTLIQGAGTANTMLHCDIQIRFITPKDPNQPIGGVSTIFDRNLNTNTALGLDLAAPQSNVDRGGRPDHIPTVTLDVNQSAGTYVQGFAQGVMNIRYIPGGRRSVPGAISQGTAIVTIHAQIYIPNASFILRNADINP
jgi:hypothetical protein